MLDRRQDQLPSGIDSADQLDDDVGLATVDEPLRVVGEQAGGQSGALAG
ncbi:hypothetical protein SDC9_141333 [bioreactor metagenome]|uniref:Uncharacterized protein n=1 Tax=bioreactor metagenome TaxID=1076179 RepID=A0A645DYI1_9ZZZZ